jgi:hypothetical protein
MGKLSRNVFFEKYPVGDCYSLALVFPDYKSGLIERATNKVLPTPNATVAEMLKSGMSADYALISEPKTSGKVQRVVMADKATLTKLAEALGAAPSKTSSHPYKGAADAVIDMDRHLKLARTFKLL